MTEPSRVAVVGAGWAGLTAAVKATEAGHQVSLFEAAPLAGGRARAVNVKLDNGDTLKLDNGQHILIGAYRDTLAIMAQVGVSPATALLRAPLSLRYPDGSGLSLPALPVPLNFVAGVLGNSGWSTGQKWRFLATTIGWRLNSWRCDPTATVGDLCRNLPPRVVRDLIAPLCVAALNTPAQLASGAVFLRVLRDALYRGPGSADLLLPRVDLSALFVQPALQWLHERGTQLRLVQAVRVLARHDGAWHLDGERFEQVILATPPWEAVRLTQSLSAAQAWSERAQTLRYQAITTVYCHSEQRLSQPMLALRSNRSAPAQFVFDRELLGLDKNTLAFVVSASGVERESIQAQVQAQALNAGLGLVSPILTIAQKRATFACVPGLQRPSSQIAPGLLACGDYVDGPYPATLEGAVRSGLKAARLLRRPQAVA